MFKRSFLLIFALIVGLSFTGTALAQEPIGPRHSDPVWQAWYWNNLYLSGAPSVQRGEAEINHDWGNGSPDPFIPSDRFSARWTRYIDVPAGVYRFTATSDDGMRVWVDGVLIIDQWYDHGPLTTSANRQLGKGHHLVVVEYYENGGQAVARLAIGPAEQSIRNWRGEYFNNTTLNGAPALVRDDGQIDFNWGNGSPAPGPIGVDYFSVRWTRSLNLPAGSYHFTVTVDDGVRLWVNNHLLIDAWRVQAPTTYSGDIYLPGGSIPIKMEYFENNGGAVARLGWRSGGGSPGATAAPPPPAAGWFGQYYANRHLSGPPAMTRTDSNVQFNWGNGAPASGFPADNFSARWSRDVYFESGTYDFFIRHDDGARVWLDDLLIIDAWYDQAATTHRATRSLRRGTHRLQIEYYEHGGQASVSAWVNLSGFGSPSSPRAETIVDNSDPGFEWGGPARGRKLADQGIGNSSYWTYNSDFEPVNYCKWQPRLPAAGRYEVLVHLPGYGNSGNVMYRILHNGQRHDKVINQAGYSNQWVSLGTYDFNARAYGQEGVMVYDNTGEAYTSRIIAFDAVKFVPR